MEAGSTLDAESEHDTPGFQDGSSLDAVEHMENGNQDQAYQPLQHDPLATHRLLLQLPQPFVSLLRLSTLDVASWIQHKIWGLALGISQKRLHQVIGV